MIPPAIKHISESFIKPSYEVEDSKHPYYLSPWGASLLPLQPMQSGLLFEKPPQIPINLVLESLKDSLSLTLVHFYPLAGQLETRVHENGHECSLFVDCNEGPGAKFVHASVELTISDFLSPTYVHAVVRALFDLNGVTNYDGRDHPLLSIQFTELLDGVFIGMSINHALADGTSFTHFSNTWQEIFQKIASGNNDLSLSSPPVHTCLLPDGYCGSQIRLPFTNPNEFVNSYKTSQVTARIFHFLSNSIKNLKEKASKETNGVKISSIQAITALAWRSVVRANRLSPNQVTSCGLAINNRPRLDPALPRTYFRTSINVIKASTRVSELLDHSLAWAALLVNQSVANHNDKAVRESLKEWMKSPSTFSLDELADSFDVLMTHSPRFDVYGHDFGHGKPLAARNGFNNAIPGNLAVYSGIGGDGSMDMEIYLPPELMIMLETDIEFIGFAKLP